MSFSVKGHHVAVLMGGLSSERSVSLISGAACADALERLGARVTRVDAARDVGEMLAQLQPQVVFNALHGPYGEDGCVQGVLETLGIPYTHSGVLASALAMDKNKAKAVMAAAGVPVPGGGLFDRHAVAAEHVIAPPYVVKPNAEGSSVGVFIVRDGSNCPPQEVGADRWAYGEQVMVEPYVAGRELAVAVWDRGSGPQAITVTDIVPTSGFYDFQAKYGEGGSTHVVPAQMPRAAFDRAMRAAEVAHAALGCHGVTRSDLRYDDINDILVLLEVNTQPGMTPMSLVPEQAAHAGIGFDVLVSWIVENAYARRIAGGASRSGAASGQSAQ